MPDERLELLNKDIAGYNEHLKVLAMRMEELAGVDCPLGACIYDPAMYDLLDKMERIQRYTKVIEDIINTLRVSGAA